MLRIYTSRQSSAAYPAAPAASKSREAPSHGHPAAHRIEGLAWLSLQQGVPSFAANGVDHPTASRTLALMECECEIFYGSPLWSTTYDLFHFVDSSEQTAAVSRSYARTASQENTYSPTPFTVCAATIPHQIGHRCAGAYI